jgi:hypothetical protein
MRNPYIKIVIILAIIGVAGFFATRFILSLPSKEERALINLTRTFQRGDYDGMNKLSIDGSFFKVLGNSRVFDTDGTEINWRNYASNWNEDALRLAIETYIKMHVTGLKYKHLSTQRLDDGARAVVHFLFDFTVNDYSTGNLLAPDVYDGSAEGDCFLVRSNDGSMVIEKLDFTLVSIEGLTLKKYLPYVQ